MTNKRKLQCAIASALAVFFVISALSIILKNRTGQSSGDPSANFSGEEFSGAPIEASELRVLAYSSFTAPWGPGPALVEMFEAQMKRENSDVTVVLLQAEDAGLLLAKMEAFPADVVIGFDQLGVRLAKSKKIWRPHGVFNSRYSDEQFLAFDWAPIGFIYRKGEIEPPQNFADLLDSRFESSIALQDPRSSSPGFQFLNWIVAEMGEDRAFEYLKKLKPNVHSMSGSWSQAYGLFTRGLAKITFSYATSILYHRISEKDDRYGFAKFEGSHPLQIEFAAISEKCNSCAKAKKFMAFLSSTEAQKIIMNRNWMFPVNEVALAGSPFATFMKEIDFQSPTLVTKDPEGLLKRWRDEGRQ